MSPIDLETLANALLQLEYSLEYCGSDDARSDPKLAGVFRAAAIQGFEFTYELSHKVLRRYIVATEPSPPVTEKLSFSDLIRTAYDRGVVTGEWKAWAEYRRLRTLTSHTYHAAHAETVFEGIPVFIEEVRHMLAAMRRSPAP